MFRTEGYLRTCIQDHTSTIRFSKRLHFLEQSIFSGRSDITSFFSLVEPGVQSSVIERLRSLHAVNLGDAHRSFWWLYIKSSAKDWLVPNWMYLSYGLRIVILHPLQTVGAFAACFHQPNPTSSSWKGPLVPAASSTTSFLRCHLAPAQLGSQCATLVEIALPSVLWLQLLLNHQWLNQSHSIPKNWWIAWSLAFQELLIKPVFCKTSNYYSSTYPKDFHTFLRFLLEKGPSSWKSFASNQSHHLWRRILTIDLQHQLQ